MSKPVDTKLYELVKKRVYSKYKVHSAFRSSALVKEYKEEFKKKYGNKSAYVGKKKQNEGLTRWHKEEWKNQRGGIGYKKKGDIYRPTKKISKQTPKTFKELSKKDIKKAMVQKKTKGRVKRF